MRPTVPILVLPMLALQVVLATAQVTAIKAGRVVNPDAGTVAQSQVILVEAGKITAPGRLGVIFDEFWPPPDDTQASDGGSDTGGAGSGAAAAATP